MRKLVLTCLIMGICIVSINAQTLFTYGNKTVSRDEFLRVYKKNSGKKVDMTDTALRTYLNLYSLFRMKVAEAEKEKLDTAEKIQKDLDSYRKQLGKNYLTDEEITKKLVREVYDRMKLDVRASHILLSCPPGADTIFVYRKIDSIYNLINTGKVTFEEMAKQFSDDKGSKENGGDLGYFSALQVVYQFENVAFTTPLGKISKPFKTQFGYHIVKVTDKKIDQGQVKVAHILFMSPKSRGEEGLAVAKKRADSALMMLKGGTPFYEVVKKYSDDKYTINDSGNLKPFGIGKMSPAFEEAAFSLKNTGDYSQPVKTDYGYHIIKLITKMPLAPYDSLFAQLKKKVENDARSTTAKEYYFNKIKTKNGFKENPANVAELSAKILATVPDTGKMRNVFMASDYVRMNKTLFTLAGKNYLQSDFAKFLETLTRGKISGPRAAVVSDAYNAYVTNVVTDFQEHKLEQENSEFGNLMREYRDGILLFELMDRNVWSKATKDSAGLKAFFETRKGKYMWEPGFEGSIYTFKNKATYDTALLLINQKFTDEQIIKELNTNASPDRVAIQRGHYEFSKFRDASKEELTANNQKVINQANGSVKLILARQVFPTSTNKSLDDARGYAVAEYQDFLEKQWNDKMKRDYPMKLNDAVFKSMIGK